MSFAEFLKKVKEFFFGTKVKPEVVTDEVVEPESPEVVADEESKPEFKVYTPMHPWDPLPHIKFRR